MRFIRRMKRAFIINETGQSFEGEATIAGRSVNVTFEGLKYCGKWENQFNRASLGYCNGNRLILWQQTKTCMGRVQVDLTWSDRYHYKESLFILLIGKFVRAPLSYDTWRIIAKMVYFEWYEVYF